MLEKDLQDWDPTYPWPLHENAASPWKYLYRRSISQVHMLTKNDSWRKLEILLFPRSLCISLLSQKSITCFWFFVAFSYIQMSSTLTGFVILGVNLFFLKYRKDTYDFCSKELAGSYFLHYNQHNELISVKKKEIE